MLSTTRRFVFLILTSSLFLGLSASSALAGGGSTTRWVALSGSVGANTSCASPGYIGVPGAQDAMDAANSGDTIHLCAGTWNTADTTTGGGFVYYDKTLIVEGEGKNNTIIDGSGRTLPVLTYDFDSYSTGLLTVRNLTIQDGNAEDPSAINSAGSLTLEDVRIRNNSGLSSAVGMYQSGGNLIIRRSELTGQAADAEDPVALALSTGPTTIEDSTIADNFNPFPIAGVFVQGPEGTDITVDSSTFTGLISSTGGDNPFGCTSSLLNYSDGADAGISITNSTFTDNIAATFECYSSHIASEGFITMKNSTFAGNTGVRENGGIPWGDLLSFYGMTLANNVIVGDPISPATCQTFQGDRTNLGGNVISDETLGCDDFVGGPSPSLQAKVTTAAIDLGPLADNGGPTTTMALGARSVARGAAIAAECPEDDQRGVTRGTPCTSGAWQAASASGKPTVKQKSRAGARSLKVRVKCGGTAPCRIKLTGTLKGGGGKLESKTVRVGKGGRTVTLAYTGAMKRSLASNGGKGVARVRAREIGGGSATTSVRISLPDSVTG